MEYLQEITLELNSNTAYTTVGAKQGDSDSRVIKIHITQNGEDWTIPSVGMTASYRIRKPDGYAIWNNATIPNPNPENVLYITLTEQTLAAAGRAYADILFTTGTANERQVLSTVSFIIIIMAAPDIAENIASSNEFARILDLTDNADVTLNEAEAWAVGTKSGIPVTEDDFSYTVQGGSFTCIINSDTFRNEVGRSPGYIRYFMLVYAYDDGLADNIWNLQYDDGTVLHNIDLNTYGVTISSGTPLPTNSIRIIVTDKDIQFENNAKYYSEQAEKYESFVRNLTVNAHTLENNESATVTKTEKDGFVYNVIQGDFTCTIDEDTFLEQVNVFSGYVRYFTFIYTQYNINSFGWNLRYRDGIIQNISLDTYGITLTFNDISIENPAPEVGDKIEVIVDERWNLNFGLPKGDTGDVNFMTFDIDVNPNSSTCGELIMYRPEHLTALDVIDFDINETTGWLEVQMTLGGNG